MLVHKTALLARTFPALGRVRLDSAADKPPGDGLARKPAPSCARRAGRAVLLPHTCPVSYKGLPADKGPGRPGGGFARRPAPRSERPAVRAVVLARPFPAPC